MLWNWPKNILICQPRDARDGALDLSDLSSLVSILKNCHWCLLLGIKITLLGNKNKNIRFRHRHLRVVIVPRRLKLRKHEPEVHELSTTPSKVHEHDSCWTESVEADFRFYIPSSLCGNALFVERFSLPRLLILWNPEHQNANKDIKAAKFCFPLFAFLLYFKKMKAFLFMKAWFLPAQADWLITLWIPVFRFLLHRHCVAKTFEPESCVVQPWCTQHELHINLRYIAWFTHSNASKLKWNWLTLQWQLQLHTRDWCSTTDQQRLGFVGCQKTLWVPLGIFDSFCTQTQGKFVP